MATSNVKFTVTPGDGVDSYWVQADDIPIELVDGSATIPLKRGEDHYLVWWFYGESGSTLAIKGQVGAVAKVEVKMSRISSTRNSQAGAKRFSL